MEELNEENIYWFQFSQSIFMLNSVISYGTLFRIIFCEEVVEIFFFFCNLNSISPLNKIPNLNKRKNQQKQKRKVPAGWPTFFKTSDGINTSSLRSQFILLWKTTVNNEQEIDTFSFQLSLHRSVYVMPKCYYVPWPDSYVVTLLY